MVTQRGKPTGVIFIGHFYNRGGYASLAHNYAEALVSTGVPCRFIPHGAEINEVKAEWEPFVSKYAATNVGPRPYVIVCDIPPRFRLVEESRAYKKIGITIFETDRIPEGWAQRCNTMDEIWLPSDFNVHTFTRSGVNPGLVKKLPIGINCKHMERGALRRATLDPIFHGREDSFSFLYLFGLHYRKGFDVLVRAFCEEFSRSEDVFLLMSCFPVKSGVLDYDPQKMSIEDFLYQSARLGELGSRAELPDFAVLERWWSNKELARLFGSVDAYLSTERASGWSLPCMEMMAAGKPVGAVDWGGGTEFMNEDNAFLIPPGPLRPIDERLASQNSWYTGHQWPDLRVADVREVLRSMYEDDALRNEKAEAGHRLVHNNFDNAQIGQLMINLMDEFEDLPDDCVAGVDLQLREHPLVVEPLEHLAVEARRIKQKYGFNTVSIALPEVDQALVERVQRFAPDVPPEFWCNLSSATGLIAKFGGQISGGQAPGDAILLSDKLSAEVREKLRAASPASARFVFDFGDDGSRYRDAIAKPVVEGSGFSGREAILVTTGGISSKAWSQVERMGLLIKGVASTDPSTELGSWRGSAAQSILSRFSPNLLFVLVDETREGQRRCLELIDIANPDSETYRLFDGGRKARIRRTQDIYTSAIAKHWSGYQSGSVHDVFVYPPFRSRHDMDVELGRILWSIPADSDIKIHAFVVNISVPRRYTPCATRGFMSLKGLQSEHLTLHDESMIDEVLSGLRNKVAIVWNARQLTSSDYHLLDGCSDALMIDSADPRMRSGFVAGFLRHYCEGRDEVLAFRQRSRIKLSEKMGSQEKVYLFGTGPSVSSALGMSFEDGASIICNTIVKSRKFVEHVKPQLILAADADFHFGPSAYAQRFRKDLVRAAKDSGALVVMPEVHALWMSEHYPDIAESIVGIPIAGSSINMNVVENFWCGAIDNVLLQLFLPLATTYAKLVALVGFDGKRPGDKKFWNHSGLVQYTDMLETVEEVHPAFFFYRDYQEYFERHSLMIETALELGERAGCSYEVLTPSVVPALATRAVHTNT